MTPGSVILPLVPALAFREHSDDAAIVSDQETETRRPFDGIRKTTTRTRAGAGRPQSRSSAAADRAAFSGTGAGEGTRSAQTQAGLIQSQSIIVRALKMRVCHSRSTHMHDAKSSASRGSRKPGQKPQRPGERDPVQRPKPNPSPKPEDKERGACRGPYTRPVFARGHGHQSGAGSCSSIPGPPSSG